MSNNKPLLPDTVSHEDPFDLILVEYLQAADSGTPPDPNAFIRRNPRFAAELREFFAGQEHFENAVRPFRPSALRQGSEPPGGARALAGLARAFEHDDQLQRLVAVKVPHRYRLFGRTGGARFAEGRIDEPRAPSAIHWPQDAAAYLSEARAAAALDHPNIVPVYDFGSTEECPCFIVSKYIDGFSLTERMRLSRLAVTESVQLVATVAQALDYAHRKGLVHRDIKPGNILIDATGKPFVVDFGLALKDGDIKTGLRHAGTPAYMSPEQARGEGSQVDGRGDIFGLGAVFYQLLTGHRPFNGDSEAKMLEQVRSFEPCPPHQHDLAIPRELDRICMKCLAKRASDRYRTAGELAQALCRWSGRSVAGTGPSEASIGPGQGGPAQFGRAVEGHAGKAARKRAPIPRGGLFALVLVLAMTAAIFVRKYFVEEQKPARVPGGAERVATAPQPASPVPAVNSNDPGATSFDPAPGLPSASADSRTAQWAIGLLGQVAVRPPNSKINSVWVSSVARLPSEPYRVNRVMVYHIKTAIITDQDLLGLRELTDLEDLNLGGCVTRVTNRGIAALGQIKGLCRLNLDGAGINDEGVAALRPLTDLHVLSLSSTAVTDRGLESFRDMNQLERLYLTDTAVTDAVADMATSSWPQLWELALPEGAVTDRGLTRLTKLQYLKSLVLCHTRIRDDQLHLLAGIKSLGKLQLDSTPITDAGLANLQAFPGLRSLSVRDTGVTAGGIARLRKALPNCAVESGIAG